MSTVLLDAAAPTFTLLSADAPDTWLDELIGLAQAARELPGSRGKKNLHPSAVLRFAQAGKLRTVKCGRRLLTTRRWLREMLGVGAAPVPPRTKLQGDRDADRALERVRRRGMAIRGS